MEEEEEEEGRRSKEGRRKVFVLFQSEWVFCMVRREGRGEV